MITIPFTDAHLRCLELQDVQAFMKAYLNDRDYVDTLISSGQAYSILSRGLGDNANSEQKVLACMGLSHFTQGRAFAWSLISHYARPRDFIGITRIVRELLARQKIRRIETTVRSDFERGHNWARKLGFVREGTMRCFGEDGFDYDLYARINMGE